MAYFGLRTMRIKVMLSRAAVRSGTADLPLGMGAEMIRKFSMMVFALLIAVPALSHARQAPTGQNHPALHLMNNTEFALFLKRLDIGALRWKSQLRNVDVKSLGLEHRETEELERSYNLCLQALDNTREEIQKLSQKQTLRLDFLLLVDLNELARNLDALNRDLTDPVTVGGSSTAQKSLGYAREVLGIDVALAPHLVEFQHHLLAFAGVIDTARDRSGQSGNQPQDQK